MYRLNPAEKKVVTAARDVAEKDIRPHADRVDAEGVFPRESLDALGAAGLLGITVPTAHGGMGLGLRAFAATLDEIAQRDASTAMVYMMHVCGVACYAAAGASFAEEMSAAAQGRHLSTLAWSERGSRSHFWAPVSQARHANGRVEINAEKSWVTSAGHADGYVVSTRRAGGEAPTDTTLYFVGRNNGGFRVSGTWNALGMRGNASAPMTFEGCAVAPERALSADGQGLSAMLGVVLPVFQVGSAAISVGLAESTVGATTAHLTGSRFQHLGGSPLAELPTLRARLAEMRIETDRARAHLVSVIDSLEAPGMSTQLLVLEVKAAASEAALKVTDLGMRTCGGAAFSRHLGIERAFRDARAAVVMAPTTDQAYDFIGRALCGMELM